MKKYFFIAIAALFITDAAQAQTSVSKSSAVKQPAKTASGMPVAATSSKEFKQKTNELRAMLNANDYASAQTTWYNVYSLMARRGDEMRKANDVPGSDTHYVLVGKLKDLSQNIPGNKQAILNLLNQMDAAY